MWAAANSRRYNRATSGSAGWDNSRLDLFSKHVEEFVTSLKSLKLASNLRGKYVSAALYSTHLHTQMSSLNHNHDSVRVQVSFNASAICFVIRS